ncbi:LysR family transcriptional regulator [uncultured Acinetobacter sp.]|uniref:LysR family transcriptional regulator n=1 Tax=uncultured Acinetobacter sp. TaxID=165433 RepID=UPI00260E4DAF|nr:LysR family transcriptional regulator [uncultured Acinetobacter sp.]
MFDKLTSMQIFISVAEIGSFIGAAEQHQISAAMVTKHIQRLESHLQLKLFQRSTRRLELTQSGADYLLTCEKILQEIHEAETNLLRAQHEIQGKIRISMPSVLGQRYVLPKLQSFQLVYPNIEIEIEVNDQRTDLIKDKFDLLMRFGMAVEPYLVARPLLNAVEMVVAASPKYWQTHGKANFLADLSQHNCLGCSMSQVAGTKVWYFDQNHDVNISGNTQSNNGLVLIDFALAHLGVIYQPRAAIERYLAEGLLIEAPLDVAGYQAQTLNLVYAKNEYMPKKLRALIDYLTEVTSL